MTEAADRGGFGSLHRSLIPDGHRADPRLSNKSPCMASPHDGSAVTPVLETSQEHRPWCDDELDPDCCRCRYATIGTCMVWIEQAQAASQPLIVIDAGPYGSELTLAGAREMRDVLDELLTTLEADHAATGGNAASGPETEGTHRCLRPG